jgi:type I restriction enzyme M protein
MGRWCWATPSPTTRFPDQRFDYLLANPPFGVDWKAEKKIIDRWPSFRGYSGKLPRINDGALLFLLYMMSKFQDYAPGNRDKPGSRTAIVFNGSPLFTGGAGSGESEIRRWIIERDQLEAIVALPEQMFYNTGIGTFIWVVTNRKAAHRKGKIQLIDARERYTPMKRSLGDKRRYLDQAALDAVTREHGALEDSPPAACSTTPTSATAASPSCARCACASRSPTKPGALPQHLPRAVRCPASGTRPSGSEPQLDWNRAWDDVQQVFKTLPDDVEGWAKGAKGTAQKKIFRDCFTIVDPEAAPVIAKHHKVSPWTAPPCSPARPCPQTSATTCAATPCWACTPTARASTSSTNPTRR